jgi:DNA-binding NtrC family response regulator
MIPTSNNRPVIVFTRDDSERNYWRAALMQKDKRVLCFEKETSCFDSLTSIDPTAIILSTESRDLVWRFIFALHALKADTRLLVISDTLAASLFRLHRLAVPVSRFPARLEKNDLHLNFWSVVDEKRGTKTGAWNDLLVGQAAEIRRINAALPGLENSLETVLITGETGTGKELLARVIANHSNAGSIFVKMDCSTIDAETDVGCELLEQVLSDGKWPSSRHGTGAGTPATMLLDKINRLDDNAQARLLLLIEGESGSRPLRIIATSEVDLGYLARHGRFRKDLFYRLNVIPIYLPPLRERKQDVPHLIDFFALAACVSLNRSFLLPSVRTVARLYAYDWPGNLDELKRAMHRFVCSGDEHQIFKHTGIPRGKKNPREDLSLAIALETLVDPAEVQGWLSVSRDMSLKSISDQFVQRTEKRLMEKALEFTHWNRKKAADLLNISYKSMLNKIKNYEIV